MAQDKYNLPIYIVYVLHIKGKSHLHGLFSGIQPYFTVGIKKG